ncbi:MAG TPA: pentapeptide repeat-containing protein [Candidatus Obscuribacterales bacterium]
MQELENAYRMLDLEPGASMEEVNQAYKDLVFIWHPDRLPKDNLRLIEKAQEKIKQLNQARDYLRTHARVGSPSANGATTGYRSRAQHYSRAYGNPTYRQRSTYGQTTEQQRQQTYESPYRAYQSRYAQSSYGSYGAYQKPENPPSSDRGANGNGTSRPSDGVAGDRPPSGTATPPGSAPRQSPYPNGNSAARSNANDGWNNYTTPRPSGTGNASYGRASGPSYTVGGDRAYGTTSSSSSGNGSSGSTNAFRARQQNPDLSGANLRGANLKEKDFSGRNLSSADLCGADLQDAFLHGVNLNRADLSNANLFRANLLQANLSHANLRGANLIGADLSGADLSGADLSGAKVAVGDRVMVKLTGTLLRGTIMPDGTINA